MGRRSNRKDWRRSNKSRKILQGIRTTQRIPQHIQESVQRTVALLQHFLKARNAETAGLCMVVLRTLTGAWPQIKTPDRERQLVANAAEVKAHLLFGSTGDPVSLLHGIEEKIGRAIKVDSSIVDGDGDDEAMALVSKLVHSALANPDDADQVMKDFKKSMEADDGPDATL